MVTASEFEIASVQILRDIRAIFHRAMNEDFEFGISSDLFNSLDEELVEHGVQAIQAMSNIIKAWDGSPQVIAEALRWMGGINHSESHHLRMNLLVSSLSDSSPWIRDGATLGLAVMKDPRALPALKLASERELIRPIRKNLEKLISKLEHIV